MKKHILFVEDNPVLLQMYPLMMESERDHWDVALCTSGEEALELLAKTPFNVVVSDMGLPGIDGIELMVEVRKRNPQASRIIISGVSDQEEVARSLGSTHQFIAKPFNIKVLKATLDRIGGLDAYLGSESLRSVVGQICVLPSFPTLYLEITKELCSPAPSVEAVAEIINTDASMTAKMLQISNSAALGLAREVGSVFEAVQHLGMTSVRSLVLSAHIFSSFEKTSIKGFAVGPLWEHALLTGRLARRILWTEGTELAIAEDAYVAGILHDVGKLMLAANLPGPFEKALALAQEKKISLARAEMEVLGASHAGVAAYLLGLWGLPAPIVEAVAFHHNPSDSPMRVIGPLAAVHVANNLAYELRPHPSTLKEAEMDMDYLAAIGAMDSLETWRELCQVELGEMEG